MGRTGRNGQDDSLRIGGRYRLVEKLGAGGMSVVWRGYDETLGRAVAVKVLSPRLADDQMFRDRLRQEALAAARLCHPHITGIYDFGEAPLDERLTVPYVVMELNDGESVAARVARLGPLTWPEAVTVVTEVASALATAHARGVVHRDVTPANVMLTPTGAKVVDFGISAVIGQRDAAPDGSLLGTPAYLAPERLGGAQVSAATDVYALGLLLYRTLTGRLPWPAETTSEALRAHLYADPEPLPTIKGLPPSVRNLCLSCLAKSPTDRPAAADVARRLAAEVGIQPVIPALTSREVRQAAAPVQSPDPPPLFSPLSPPSAAGSVSVTGSLAAAGSSAGAGSLAGTGSLSSGAVASALGSTGPVSANADLPVASRLALGRALLAYLGLPGGTVGPRPSLGLLRLRAGLKIGTALRVGEARPLGGGLFAGGSLARDVVTGRAFRSRTDLPPSAPVATDSSPARGSGRGRSATGVLAGRGALAAGSPTGGTPTVVSLPGRGTRNTHRIRAALITVALAGTAGASWAITRSAPPEPQVQAAGGTGTAAAAVPADVVCAVRYQLRRDSGTHYEALLTVATIDEIATTPWRVQFSYPGSQRLTGTPRAVTQKGRKVVAKGSGKLQTFTLRGNYDGYNPLPLAFTLDGHRCRAEVLAALTKNSDSQPVSEAAGAEKKPTRGEGGGQPHRDRPPRKSSAPQKRATPDKPAPTSPTSPPPAAPPIRKGEGFSLAL